jgi:polyhydroxyalkanoate synthesis regulator phasin
MTHTKQKETTMPTKKKAARKMTTTKRRPMARKANAAKRRPEARKGAAERLRQTWTSTVEAITAAESDLEKQIKALLHRNKISTKDASAMFKDLSALVSRERKKALRDLEKRMSAIQARAVKQRKVVGAAVDDAVQGTLARFNLPTRHEVRELTRKVDELSRKIDRFKR